MADDLIRLMGVLARGHHGVLEHERRDGQHFVVDVVMSLDLAPAGTSDDLALTVNYAEVAADVVAIVGGPAHDLIETVAEEIAERTLARPLVQSVEVTVHKPQAPVGVPFGDVEVVVRRRKDIPVVIALGANLEGADGADPAHTVRAAVRRLRRVRGLRAVRPSSPYASAPVGGAAVAGQPDYVNAVALARTSLGPLGLLAALHDIEADLGRTRGQRWEARRLDLDLIQYGPADAEVVSTDPELTLPHPRAHERAFVLAPWAQLDAGAALRVGDELVMVRELLEGPEVAEQELRPIQWPT